MTEQHLALNDCKNLYDYTFIIIEGQDTTRTISE